MATLAEVSATPASGMNHVDALLSSGPGWNWLAPTRTTLYYTFALAPANAADAPKLSGLVSTFNAAQQAAVVSALSHLAAVTGISFVATGDGNTADLHFGAANVADAGVAGLCSWNTGYSISGNTVSDYRADAWIYLDNAEFAASTSNPTPGTAGFQILLHELGHAMGLKHPFEGNVTLPSAQDSTANTLLSYTASGGPYSSYQAYDIAALMWLYGGDGLGGLLGHSTAGRFVVGTTQGDTLGGGGGDDVLEGGAGNDHITGGSGSDTARFSANRALYTVTSVAGGFQVSGPDGVDTLIGVEKARFLDQTLTLQSGGNAAPSGALAVSGTPAQGSALGVISTLADADGLGTLSYRWQSSSNGASWADIAAATAASFTPGQADVGLLLRVVGGYTDGQGNAESVASAATSAVANVNDAPGGIVLVSGDVQQGRVLSVTHNITDADGLGSIGYRWQSSLNGQVWSDVATATNATFTPGEAQVGHRLRAVASYVDGQGTPESVPSASTASVLNSNDAPGGTVMIAGLAEQGQVLTASHTLSDVDGLGVVTYQWQSSAQGTAWSAIAGANSGSLTLGSAQVGQLVRALARYTDGQGTAESVASSASASVIGLQTGSAGADELIGTIFADRLMGLAGNDRLSGRGGADRLDGGPGIDTAIFELARADYLVAPRGTSVTTLAGNGTSAVLLNVERVQFSGLNLAFDVDGAAGTTARILGAVFGREALSNTRYVGIGLSELDAGTPRDALMQLALDARLGANFGVADMVRLLYRNLVSVEPNVDELNHWTGAVAAGQYTPVSLAWYAANLDLNASNINLVGLAESGLAFT